MKEILEDQAFTAWMQLAKEAGLDRPDSDAIERARWRLLGAQQVCLSIFGQASEAAVMATFGAINAEASRLGAVWDAL